MNRERIGLRLKEPGRELRRFAPEKFVKDKALKGKKLQAVKP